MADNVEANAGSGGATFATDDIGGVHYPRSKVVWGADGAVNDTSAAAPLPVVQTGTPALPTGAATAARQDTGNTSLATLAGAVAGTEMQVDVVSSALPTGAATAAKQPALGTAGSASADVISVQGIASMTAVQIADNGGSITVDASSLPLPTGASTAAKQPALGTAGSASADVITVQGVASMTPLQIADNGGSLTVDGSVSLAAAIPAGTNNIGDVDIVTMPNVTLAAGTNTNEVVGDVAHDAAAAGNPVLIAARANANEPTAVADADATYLWADLLGRLVTIPGHPSPEAPVTSNPTSSGNNTIIAAPGANVSLHICKGSIHNSGAANITVILQDGAGGTGRFAAELAAEGGGTMFDFGARGWKLTANTLLNANLSGAGDVRVNITEYYIAA